MARTKMNGLIVNHVDAETGEIICTTSGCTCIEDNSKTEAELEKEEYKNTHCLNFNKNESSVKMFPSVMAKIATALKPSELKTICALSKYIEYETNILFYGNRKNKHYMTLQEISEVTGIDDANISKVINPLIKKGVLGIFKTVNKQTGKKEKYYVVNPYIYFNGKNCSKTTLALFENSGWKEFLN